MSKVIQQQKQYNILLIGEVCQDVYVFGNVERLNPEAPVPILKKNDKESKLGMSGNVHKNLKSILPESNITVLQNDSKALKKIRFIDEKSKYQLMIYDIEKDIKNLSEKEVPDNNYDAIVISDYNKGLLTQKFIDRLCAKYNQTNIFVDTKKSNLKSFKNCIIKLNEKENKNAFNLDNSCSLIVTLGSRGCSYKGKFYSTHKVEVHDVCGAGDVFLATLVARWLETNNIERAIKSANNCAALSVTNLGCYTIKRSEYENLRV